MRTKRSIIICATPRCGSWLLSHAIASAPEVKAVHEWFVPSVLAERSHAYGLPSDTPFPQVVRAIVEQETSSSGIFCAKIMFDTWQDLIRQLALPHAAPDGSEAYDLFSAYFPHPRFVHLTRADKVKQAVSYAKSLQTGIWVSAQNRSLDARQTVADALLTYDYHQIYHLRTYLIQWDADWRAFFQACEIDAAQIGYESLITDYSSSIQRALRWLDLTLSPESSMQALPDQRMADTVNREWYARFHRTEQAIEDVERAGGAHPLPASAFVGDVSVTDPVSELRPGQRYRWEVQVRNRSECVWPAVGGRADAGWMMLTATWVGVGKEPFLGNETRIALNQDLAPGETTTVPILVHAPKLPGEYRLQFEVGQTGMVALGTVNAPSIQVPVCVHARTKQVEDLFGALREMGDGWLVSEWFGRFFVDEFPWVRHADLGPIYCKGTGPDNLWLHVPSERGWLWTSRSKYPVLWSAERKMWLRSSGASCRLPPLGEVRRDKSSG